ncbi:MAG: hydrogenase formation protein HypD [Candidatus Lambdaproteobacteria bacterium]|nr:hydrogenase formation protein HypD [Candidatus Lambdaproteobacteria bacterium]
MKYMDEFRDGRLARKLLREIAGLATGRVRIMEICGGHTHVIFKYGLDKVMPPAIELIHGPGCPVCVTPLERVDQAIELARLDNVMLATFADMIRVPGSRSSLQQEAARGADIRMVYSSLDALQLARAHPEREVVFFAIGFETTAPTNAMAVLLAQQQGLRNFSVFSNHVTVPPAVRAILDAPDVQLDAFIAPGHVSLVTGSDVYGFMAREYGKQVAVSGFEPLDILQSVAMILRQRRAGRAAVENQYTRAVSAAGNRKAQAVIERVMLPCDFRWRGLGIIPGSGLRLRPEFADFDAERRFALGEPPELADPKACECGQILRGAKSPWDCRVFGKGCTPENPIGSCMVSSEGACAAYYNYGRHQQRATS